MSVLNPSNPLGTTMKILGFLLVTITFSPTASNAQTVQWSVVDAGWCDLVYLPNPQSMQQMPMHQMAMQAIKKPSVVRPSIPKIEITKTTNFVVPPAIQTTIQTTNPPATQPTAESDEEGFESLFNGKDLEGWVIQGMEKAGPKIEADGVMKVGGWDYWAVITKEEFHNFILRFEVKFEPKGNSGILIHTPKKEVYKSSFEIQMADDEGKADPLKWPGAIFGLVAPTKNAFLPIGEWNQVEIKYDDPHIWVTVNGELVQNGVDVSKIEGLKHKLNKGGIALQRNDYKKAAFYRNLRIKRLPD